MTARASIWLAVLLAACSSTPAPQPSTRTDADKTALARENIDAVWCGSEPAQPWCPVLRRVNGEYDVLVTGTSLFIAVHPTTPTVARAVCSAMATAAYDANGQPIGYRHVHVMTGPDTIAADCTTLK